MGLLGKILICLLLWAATNNAYREYIIQYNKERRIFDEDDVHIWELDHLCLSYKNIIKIDNLGGMLKLTKLQLDNNIICKI